MFRMFVAVKEDGVWQTCGCKDGGQIKDNGIGTSA